MILIARFLAALFIAFGSMVAVRSSCMRWILEFFREGKKVYLAALVRVIVGGVFLVASTNSSIPWLMAFVGLLCIWTSFVMFLLKLSALQGLIDWWLELDDKYLNISGIILIFVGALLLLAA